MALQINPISESLGVEVLGIDLRKPLEPKTIKTVYKAFVDNVILVFRDQKLDHHQFLAAAK